MARSKLNPQLVGELISGKVQCISLPPAVRPGRGAREDARRPGGPRSPARLGVRVRRSRVRRLSRGDGRRHVNRPGSLRQ